MDTTGPRVDVILLTRDGGAIHPDVDRALRGQSGVALNVVRVIGAPLPEDRCRYETIARARNDGKVQATAPWVMFVDDDVVLDDRCAATLIGELRRRPAFGALAADYLGEGRPAARHVAMGATMFRSEALRQVHFRWRHDRCECQCCCDDLRRVRWGIDYCRTARAFHLPQDQRCSPARESERQTTLARCQNERPPTARVTAPSVCLVVCFFGPLPAWMPHYLQSCGYNPSIDFLILTDQVEFPATPPNVRVRPLAPAEFNSLASEKTGFRVALSHARKLCDFKPVYGHLFEDLLRGWDYWGYGDVDVIYGDLRRFLGQANLGACDVFTARREYLVGHFTLFRNTRDMRLLYQRSADLQRTLQSPEVLSFDECGKQWWRRFAGQPLTRRATCDSMSHVVQRLSAEGRLTPHFSPAAVEWTELKQRDWRVRWKDGRLAVVDPPREAMYFHFHAFKEHPGYRDAPHFVAGAPFDMTSAGFATCDAKEPRTQ